MPDFRPLHSQDSKVSTYCNFVNKSQRAVYLYWVDFHGGIKRYNHIQPGERQGMKTFVTHPWTVRDAVNMYPLLLNGRYIYYPEGNAHDEDTVNITIPVYPLLRRCLEVVSKTGQVNGIKKLKISPKQQELLMRLMPTPKNSDYTKLNADLHDEFCQR